MELNDIPIEVMETIFKEMDGKTVQESRLVCKKWNREILSHGEIGIILDQNNTENLDFLFRTNAPKSLRVTRLDTAHKLSMSSDIHCLKKLRTIHLQFANPSEISTSLLKHLSVNYSSNLTSLKLSRPVLGRCELKEDPDNPLAKYSLFPHLTRLSLMQRDRYSRICNGKDIQRTSRNIGFLLTAIGSVKLKILNIQLNNNYYDINCCAGRLSHRFEAFVLFEFICRQPGLEELYLDIPESLPNKTWLPKNPLPTGLKTIYISCKTGTTTGICFDGHLGGQLLSFPELLVWNLDFYDNCRDPMQLFFWKSLFLVQKNVKSIHYGTCSMLSLQEIPRTILENNMSSLKKLSLQGQFNSEIDGKWFAEHTCRIQDIMIWNILYEELEETDDEQPCRFVHINSLPETVTSVSFKNMILDADELMALGKLVSLNRLSFTMDHFHYVKLETLPNIEQIVSRLLRHRGLDYLGFGQINFTNFPLMHNVISKLDPWFVQGSKTFAVM